MKKFLIAIGASYLSLLLVLFAFPRIRGETPGISSDSRPASSQPLKAPAEAQRKRGSPRSGPASTGNDAVPEAKSVRTLYRSGAVSGVWLFRDGELSGESLVYHENGNIWMKRPFEKGREHGSVKIYDEQGRLTTDAVFESGVQNGRAAHYYPDGSVWVQENWKDGGLEAAPLLYSERMPAPVSAFAATPVGEGKEITVFKTLYAAGSLSGEWTAAAGNLDGPARLYFPGGGTLSDSAFKSGRKDGNEFHYDVSGRMRWKESYADGVREGVSALFYPDGSLLAEIRYAAGKITGAPKFYSEGSVLSAEPQTGT